MGFTESDQRVWLQLKKWEKLLLDYQPTDMEMTIEKWIERGFSRIGPTARETFFEHLDTWLFQIHTQIQGSQSQMEARDRIMKESRIFQEHVTDVTDLRKLSMDQLNYIAEKQMTRSRLISMAQGGLTGTGGILVVGSDIPAMAIINLRAIQLLATSYGFDVRTPFETMISLKLFHLATLPKSMQATAWHQLVQEIKVDHEPAYFYEGDERLTDERWMKQPIKQLLKTIVIVSIRKKAVQGLPLISMAIGAGMNYTLTKNVTDFAQRFYQLRVLLEKRHGE